MRAEMLGKIPNYEYRHPGLRRRMAACDAVDGSSTGT
jgi:hypothetical protein